MNSFTPPPSPTPQTDKAIFGRLISNEAPIDVCFDTLIRYAASRKATDFFCASRLDGFEVFMRCEGTLYPLGIAPTAWGEHFINFVRVKANISINEHKHPVEGRIQVRDGEQPIDLRVNFMPTFFGEELAIRILDSRFRLVDLGNLGMLPQQLEQTQRLAHERMGLVLVTGRTGSGKTTTLYAILNALNDGNHKINTLEDPVECQIHGVSQSQVDHTQGQTFVELLRALLRHAPDVIMVGEIRDVETANVAVQAAVAGQAVFATLHAQSASEAIYSLLQLGVDPYVAASALRGVIAQDMLRKPCSMCSQPAPRNESDLEMEEIRAAMGADFTPTVLSAGQCERCDHRGSHGLSAIFEVLEVTPPIRTLIRRETDPALLARAASKLGMLPKSIAAQIAVARGLAFPEEAMHIVRESERKSKHIADA